MKIQYHSVKKNYKKLATRAISTGHLASSVTYKLTVSIKFSCGSHLVGKYNEDLRSSVDVRAVSSSETNVHFLHI